MLFNCLGREKAESDSIPALLVRQVQSSVYMEDTLRRLGELGVDHILEVGPGNALSGFVKKTLPGVPCVSVETPEQLDAVLTAWKEEAMSEETVTRAAVVTGGSRGIGRAVCVALAKQGCNVVVNYCHGEEPAARRQRSAAPRACRLWPCRPMFPPPRAAKRCLTRRSTPLAGWMCW